MFHSARLQLTGWYLLIIMIISSLFSVVVYSSIDSELDRIETFQQGRQKRIEQVFQDMPGRPNMPEFEREDIQEARDRVVFTLFMINAGILVVSGGAGYFLAGRTLRPIESALEDQRRFVTDASHELRTPLTSLRSELEVSLRDKNMTIQEAKQLLNSNLEEVIHLQSLSDGLLALSKNEHTKRTSLSEMTLLSVLEESLRKVTPLASQKHISIQQKLQDATLVGDKHSLVELFVILLDNAIKYSPEKSQITLRSKKLLKTITVEVIDQGIGIDKKDIPHIFERFYRSDKARTHTDSSGYGLGLSIAQRIVADHNGDIHVKSAKGTTFIIRIPLKG